MQLIPTLTTRYMRTAFQLGRDSTVRVSLDTGEIISSCNLLPFLFSILTVVEDLHMILEKGYEGGRWGRELDSVPVEESDICRFPYAILEVKLNIQLGNEPPAWITNLISSDMVLAVTALCKKKRSKS